MGQSTPADLNFSIASSISSHSRCFGPTTNLSCPAFDSLWYSATISGLIAFAVCSPDTVNSFGLQLKKTSVSISFTQSMNGCLNICVPLVSNVIDPGRLSCSLSVLYMPTTACCPVTINGSPPVKHRC